MVFFLLLILLLCSGCSSKIQFDFYDKKIVSLVEIKYTLDEYRMELKNISHEYDEDFSDSKLRSMLDNQLKNEYSISAFKNLKGNYNLVKYDDNNINYMFEYTYNNFKDNYFFNNCFDDFSSYEDKKIIIINYQVNIFVILII